ncbi:glycosyltransferase family 4 protein [Helicobacter ailurogastricus]|uniref:glycosyltransferase family 4 protein n=1 Tax=Helicobacter ailurogastricus TaxID=1578720 RepID=UPI001F31ED94|nr:glycosyltransferase family 4 protein [Helicobacter ailurogastricus]
MVVLFCTEQYYPLQTGTAVADYNLTRALSQAGHQVFVLTSGSFAHQKLTREGAKQTIQSGTMQREAIQIAPNLSVIAFNIYAGVGGWQGELQAYKDFVQNFACDLLINVTLLTWNSNLIISLLPSLKAHKKVLINHGEQAFMSCCFGFKRFVKDSVKFLLTTLKLYPKGIYPWWFKEQVKRHIKHYDRVFFLHNKSHGYAYLKPFCSSVGILPNGVFAKDICPPKSLEVSLMGQNAKAQPDPKLSALLDTPYVLNVSNYYPEKGQDFVLRAYYLSQARLPLIFIGALDKDHTLSRLKASKAQLDADFGFKEVFFYYALARDEVLEASKRATLFLHASHAPYEAFPMVILECLQFATPFVCTPIGNVKELCPDLIAHTPQEMAEKINTLLNDPAHYAKVSTGLHEKVQAFCYDQLVKLLEEV